jgi:MOSC domain-containing protein YiiM
VTRGQNTVMNAQVVQVNTSPGGVPKIPRFSGDVRVNGISGDGHTARQHWGPEKALCLYSLDRILDLQREGHPIFPGSTGENLTIAGLPWDEIVPGDRFAIGDAIIIEITSYTAPCAKIAASFRDEDFSRMDHETHPGWARLYARVVHEGIVRPGDRIARKG